MDLYVLLMYSLSSFGFIIIFVSLYLLLTVSTKLTPFTRFVIHGHDLSSAFTQLYMTLGTVPVLILPCASGYSNGFFTELRIMSTYNQIWSLFSAISLSSSFSLLLPINRAFAVSHRMNKWKRIILSFYFFQAFCQVFVLAVVGIHLQDGGEKAKWACIKQIKSAYPIEMYTMQGVNYIASEDKFVTLTVFYALVFTVLYLVTSTICGVVLIRSIRIMKKTSQSAVFLASQRSMTVGILYFVFLELFALGIPFISLSVCVFFNIGSPIIGQLACSCIAIYPIFGSYYVLMSNPSYKRKVFSIMKRAYGTTSQVRSASILST